MNNKSQTTTTPLQRQNPYDPPPINNDTYNRGGYNDRGNETRRIPRNTPDYRNIQRHDYDKRRKDTWLRKLARRKFFKERAQRAKFLARKAETDVNKVLKRVSSYTKHIEHFLKKMEFLRKLDDKANKAETKYTDKFIKKYIEEPTHDVWKGTKNASSKFLHKYTNSWVRHTVDELTRPEVKELEKLVNKGDRVAKQKLHKAVHKAIKFAFKAVTSAAAKFVYTNILEKYGVKVEWEAFKDMQETFYMLLDGSKLWETAVSVTKQSLIRRLEAAGYDLEKYGLDKVIKVQDMEEFVGITARALLERAGVDTTRNFYVNQFLRRPDLRNLWRKTTRNFAKKTYGRAKERVTNIVKKGEEIAEDVAEEAAELGEAAEAEMAADSVIELAPLLLL